jgi:hypothetical protein|tara:strand:+ start:6219 stop:6623 length:405 start_codon:yes stop_codon:yes gene_type:complete
MDKDTEIFKGKSFANLAEDIYSTSKKKETQINLLIAELKPLISNIGDATIIVPLIKDYLEIGVKNDELIVKLSSLIQRMIANNGSGNDADFGISEEEKKQLLDTLGEIEDLDKSVKETKVKTSESIDGIQTQNK